MTGCNTSDVTPVTTLDSGLNISNNWSDQFQILSEENLDGEFIGFWLKEFAENMFAENVKKE